MIVISALLLETYVNFAECQIANFNENGNFLPSTPQRDSGRADELVYPRSTRWIAATCDLSA